MDANRLWDGLNYIAGTPCACDTNGSRVYQHPDRVAAVCVGCLAKAYLATPKASEPAPETEEQRRRRECPWVYNGLHNWNNNLSRSPYGRS